ncbi:hypothetical protein C8P68_101513 [Mucilaginibacter yixingensis]|uniref:Uncharacterized protein n=1 Tax=Mucilaginibacter yixingensis TaxID=1295612 RepID=A0A2T5JFT6_9SPHI|nr:hypothetical protein C8P68_101513 [Mucilaginibacter yixingensis]
MNRLFVNSSKNLKVSAGNHILGAGTYKGNLIRPISELNVLSNEI